MSWMKPLTLIGLLLAGCASQPGTIQPLDSHPASSHAHAGAMPMMSQTLVIGEKADAGHAAMQGHAHDHAVLPTNEAAPDPHAGHAHGDTKPADNATLYVCPMHPEVTSTLTDQKCPKCGMKLVPKDQVKDPS